MPNNNQTNRQPYQPAKLSGIPRQPSQPKTYLDERSSPRIRTCAVVLQRIHQWPPTNWLAEVWICWWLDPCYTIKYIFTSWEYTVSWYRTPERVLWLLEAAPKRKEDSGDLLSPWQQTGCQTKSDTSGIRGCTRLCTKVPRCDSW